jgi:branched-chain amino acid transport system permease protein
MDYLVRLGVPCSKGRDCDGLDSVATRELHVDVEVSTVSAIEFYIVTLLIFACLNSIAALGFNLQFGHAGIINLAIIMLVAVGAYGAGIASVGPATGSYTFYIGGFGWGFPWNVFFGTACAAVFSFVLGLVALRRLRHDYLALALIAILQGLLVLVTNEAKLFNGVTGITNIPGPWDQQLSPEAYQYVFLGISLVALVGTYVVIARVTGSPLGRAFHAIRDDEVGGASLGKNTWRFKMVAFVVGGTAAGLSGSLQAIYGTGWSPSAWGPMESLGLLAAIIVGGRGRNLGAVLGSVVVLGIVIQGSTFLPQIGPPSLLPNLQSMTVGLLLLAFLWFRPEGVLPEQKDKYEAKPGELSREPATHAGVGA